MADRRSAIHECSTQWVIRVNSRRFRRSGAAIRNVTTFSWNTIEPTPQTRLRQSGVALSYGQRLVAGAVITLQCWLFAVLVFGLNLNDVHWTSLLLAFLVLGTVSQLIAGPLL
jgi:hypothetical protein